MITYVTGVVRFRWIALSMILGLTVWLLSFLGQLNIIVDDANILPQDHPYVVAANDIEAVFGQKYTVVVTVTPKTGDIFQRPVLNRIAGMTAAIEAIPGTIPGRTRSLASPQVKSIYGKDGDLVVERMVDAGAGAVDPDAVRARLDRMTLYESVLVSRDRRTASISAEFASEPKGYAIVAAKVETAVAPFRDDSVSIHMGGQPIIVGAIETYGNRLNILLPVAILIIGLLHWEAFRSIQGLVLPLVTALVAVVWALGGMAALGVSLDPFNSLAPIVILAVAAGHAVQILKRFYEDYEAESFKSPDDPPGARTRAVISSVARTGPIMVCAGGIAAVSFLSLMVFDVESIRNFGIFTAIGVLGALFLELTLIPALRSILPPPKPRKRRRNAGFLRAALWLTDAVINRRKQLLGGAAIVFFVVGAGGYFLTVNSSLRANFTADQTVRQDDAFINEHLAGANTLHILIDGCEDDAIKRPEVMSAIVGVQRRLEGLPGVGKTLSIADFILSMDAALKPNGTGEGGIPAGQDSIAQYLFLYSLSADPGDFDTYVDYGYRKALVTVFLRDESSKFLERLTAEIGAELKTALPADVTYSIGGTITGPSALNEVLVIGKLNNILMIAAVLFVFSSVLFRSPLVGLLIVLPLAATVLINYGVMGWFGIPLQMATATISAMAVGIGADYAIYFTYRLREELLRSSGDLETAVLATYKTAGQAVIYVATAVIGGYSVLMLSYGFLIHFWLGLLVTLSMLVAAAAALTVFPALLVIVRPRSIFGDEGKPVLLHKTANVILLAGVLGGALAGLSTPSAAAPSAKEIMDANYAVSRTQDASYTGKFTLISRNGQERVRHVLIWTMLQPNGIDMSRLSRFTSPSDIKGTATLILEDSKGDDGLWIYLPAIGKTRRLVASNKKDSYVGTDLSYGDVIGYRTSDWNSRVTGVAEIDQQPCWIVESVPVNDTVASDSAYSKRISWIRQDNFVTAKGELYDTAGRLQKTFTQMQIEKVSDQPLRWQPMLIEVHNVLTGHSTRFEFSDFQANTGLSERLFSPRTLERGR
ncbi:outer membrane lipoprotein-sorting protein [Nisaea sp.]|uniref:outer membrane lipoprotein-sorting protein n=1 Tax=Nisaea sp. TaxID=2024842 RepID=UPI0032ECA27C